MLGCVWLGLGGDPFTCSPSHTVTRAAPPAGRCEPKGALTGSNAGITSIDFDSAVSLCSVLKWAGLAAFPG